jgi:hypothetical protein
MMKEKTYTNGGSQGENNKRGQHTQHCIFFDRMFVNSLKILIFALISGDSFFYSFFLF